MLDWLSSISTELIGKDLTGSGQDSRPSRTILRILKRRATRPRPFRSRISQGPDRLGRIRKARS